MARQQNAERASPPEHASPPSGQAFVRAASPVGGAVASVVGYRAAGMEPTLHRGLPSPFLTVVFALDAPVVCGDSIEHARGPDAYRCRIVLAGLHDRPSYVVQPDRQEGVQLAVHPLAARALFGMPAAELRRRTEDGADVLGAPAAHLHAALAETPGWDGRFALLAGHLRERAADAGRRPAGRVRPEIAEAWRWLAWHRGTGTVEGVARHVALSPRRLGTLFLDETGMTPGQVNRLMRFQQAVRRITAATTAGEPADLARTAAETGFFDHSHLVRDFRRYAGLSPTQWIGQEFRNIQAGGHRNGEP